MLKNEKGMIGAMEIGLIVVIVGILGFVGWRVMEARSDDDNSVVNQQESIPPAAEEETQAESDTKTIPGINVNYVSNSTTDKIEFVYGTEEEKYKAATITSPALIDYLEEKYPDDENACAEYGAIGLVSVSSKADLIGDAPEQYADEATFNAALGKNVIQIGDDNYAIVSSSQAYCHSSSTDDQEAIDLDSEVRDNLQDVRDAIKAAYPEFDS